MKKLVTLVAILGLLALGVSACTPAPVSSPSAQAPEANLRFLISDEPNDIDDFEQLNVTVSSLGVQQSGDNGTWLQFSPDIDTIDLKELQGKNALEVWSGNVTPGQYTKVFVYVSEVKGTLADNTTANVTLPSGKLQISKPFTVSENGTTSFVFDITVIEAGGSGKYILKPQIAESGANIEYSEVKAENKDREREERQLKLRIEGSAQPGTEVVLTVTDKGESVEGASVTVNGQEVGLTDGNGEISVLIPADIEEVEIEATLDGKSGEFELSFEEETEEEDEVEVEVEIEGEDEEEEENGVPPAIPHTLQGRDNCLACHSENGLKPFPSDHAGRTSDTCTSCHQPE